MLFHSSTHSLVAFYMCPDRRLNLQPGSSGQQPNQLNYLAEENLTNLNINIIPKHPPSWETLRWETYTDLDDPFQLKRQIIESVETKSVSLWGRELERRELHRKRKRAPITYRWDFSSLLLSTNLNLHGRKNAC